MSCQVSIIIVSWNGKEFLQDCLSSVRKQDFRDFETIVVDNGSSDGTVAFLEQSFPEVKIVSLDENRGFSGGNIAGLEVAKGQYIALLNNDALPRSSWLTKMVKALENHKDCGICASKMIVWNTDFIDAAGDIYLTAGIAQKRGNGKAVSQFQEMDYVFGACAGAVLYRRAMLDEIGFFDESFFAVNEDTDLNFRAQLMGWKCLYVPEAVVYHKVSLTRKRQADLLVYYKVRNADYVLIKNMPTVLLLRYVHHIVAGQILSLMKFGLYQRQWRAVLKAKVDTLKSFSLLLQKRRDIQRNRVAANSYIRSILVSLFSRDVLR